MFVVQITETQMQIEINGDAARLQLKHREIKSLHFTASELARLDLERLHVAGDLLAVAVVFTHGVPDDTYALEVGFWRGKR